MQYADCVSYRAMLQRFVAYVSVAEDIGNVHGNQTATTQTLLDIILVRDLLLHAASYYVSMLHCGSLTRGFNLDREYRGLKVMHPMVYTQVTSAWRPLG